MPIAKLALLLFLLSSGLAFGVQVTIDNPCAKKPWLDVEKSFEVGSSVGSVTMQTLDAHKVPYIGAERGINSIRGTVTGDDALEVVSDTEMRAYGWCFHLNGEEPNEMADAAKIKSDSDLVRWFFAFAHYKDGKWIAMCVPTAKTLPKHVCSPKPK